MPELITKAQQELHNVWLFIDTLLTVGMYTGLILVPVVLLVVSWLQAKARSIGRDVR